MSGLRNITRIIAIAGRLLRRMAPGRQDALLARRASLALALDGVALRADNPQPVALVGAGPGDPGLLTVAALRAIEAADVILHDRLISDEILALAPARTELIAVGKEGFGPSMPQSKINALIVEEARRGRNVVRLKSGDPGIYGRLDEEITALEEAGLDWRIVPGITSASAAAAGIGQSLTQRGRNTGLRILTGHDVAGFAEQDWRGLAQGGEVAAIYMAKKSARFLQGRLMMHGAAADTPVSVVENASRPEERVIAATLADLPRAVAGLKGPAILLYGLAPRRAAALFAQNAERKEAQA